MTAKLNDAHLTEVLNTLSQVRSAAKDDKNYGFDKPFPEFLRIMSLLNPQSYGQRIQNRIGSALNWKRMKVHDDRGDLVNDQQQHYEVKASLITETNLNLNLVQIRLWQNVNYICLWFNVQTQAYSVYVLSHEQMEQEVSLLASSAHGTKNANEQNQKKELRISLAINPQDPDFQRWEKHYKSPLLDGLFNN